MNYGIENKEYVIQRTKRGYRAISWHPHYIMTDFVKSKERAIEDGDKAIDWFYDKMKKAGEASHIVYERMIKEQENK